MGLLAMIAAALLPAAAPVDQFRPIAIHPGETIMLRVDGGNVVVEQRGPAPPMSAFEAAALRRSQAVEVPAGAGIQPAMPITKRDVDVPAPAVTPERVRLTYRLVPGVRPDSGQHSFLVILNGYTSSFRYRVLMHVRGDVTPTDVCEVLPNVPGNEHWPYVIDRLDITAAWLEPVEGGSIRCE